jgi:hypothetical protein
MSTLYIDRGFISINGVEVIDVENISIKQSDGTKAVGTMTRNRRNKGYTKGNRDYTVAFSVAVQAKLGTPKIENIDFDNQSVQLTFEHGGDRLTLIDLNHVDTDQSAPSVGTEGKKAWNMLALDLIDQVGNSALFPTSLTSI